MRFQEGIQELSQLMIELWGIYESTASTPALTASAEMVFSVHQNKFYVFFFSALDKMLFLSCHEYLGNF